MENQTLPPNEILHLPPVHHTVSRRPIPPVIRREGIDWHGGDGTAPLVLVLEFENPGLEATDPTLAMVRVAAFGAFLTWQPLTTVTVPSGTATGGGSGKEMPSSPASRD